MTGNNCPNCGKEGTVYRCPRRHKGGHWDDGSEVICYICINCTLPHAARHAGDDCSSSLFCTPGLAGDINKDQINWKETPEISEDLYEIITELYADRHRLETIRASLGVPPIDVMNVVIDHANEVKRFIASDPDPTIQAGRDAIVSKGDLTINQDSVVMKEK